MKYVIYIFYVLHLYMFYTVLYKAQKKKSVNTRHTYFLTMLDTFLNNMLHMFFFNLYKPFQVSVSDTVPLCIFCLFLANKIFKDRDSDYCTLVCPTASNTKQGNTQYRIPEYPSINVFQAFCIFCIPNYKIFQGSLTVFLLKSQIMV